MKRRDRYDTTDLEEAQYEPGSKGRVLKNLLGIRTKRKMDNIEAEEQHRALEELVQAYGPDHRFTAADVCTIHKIWLGRIYRWAGLYRQVNVSKGTFPFAAPAQIPRLMADFERDFLGRFSPCRRGPVGRIAQAIADIHVELMLIHPFREGNGRTGRLLSILMGLQGGLPVLFFGDIKGQVRQEYFRAVQAGMDRNYEPMRNVFTGVIRRTLQIHDEKEGE